MKNIERSLFAVKVEKVSQSIFNTICKRFVLFSSNLSLRSCHMTQNVRYGILQISVSSPCI